MGTRHVITIISDGEVRVAEYGQFDGYVDYTGVKIAEILKDADLNILRKKLNDVKLVRLSYEYYNHVMLNEMPSNTPVLRENVHLGVKVLDTILNNPDGQVLSLVDEEPWVIDNPSCEYIYRIDLDREKLTIYSYYADKNSPCYFTQSEPLGEKAYCRYYGEVSLIGITPQRVLDCVKTVEGDEDDEDAYSDEADIFGDLLVALRSPSFHSNNLITFAVLSNLVDEMATSSDFNQGDVAQLQEDLKDLTPDERDDEYILAALYVKIQLCKKL